MLKRELEKECLNAAEIYPIVTIIGPRQSGKTTLATNCFPEKPYVNLEKLDIRELAITNPNAFLANYPNGAILDEIQRVPPLLSYLQVLVDEQKQMGQFILTGSNQFELQEAITQSLAGRTAVLKLLPLSLSELNHHHIKPSLEELLLNGGYPRLYQIETEAHKYFSHYCQTYLERDVRKMSNIKDLIMFQNFMRLVAARIGCMLNLSDLASELGVAVLTIKNWLAILEASYLIFRLPPYFENLGKRIVKTPKLYFTDVGLACYLLGLETTEHMSRDPLRGKLFENLVILELMKTRFNQGYDHRLYYYRDKNQLEVDVLFQRGNTLIPIEIKASETYKKQFSHGLYRFKSISSKNMPKSYIVYSGELTQKTGEIQLLNYWDTQEILT